MEVFKVETVGDCYVAVTGLPRPQADHVIIMSKFATECCLKVGRVTHHLAEQLGPETLTLNLRGGMHSGPVTAGVLRGAKARFQLFGDTVNTAARMESTGVPSKVQLSLESGELLLAANKGDWVNRREEDVEAKGKGQLRTYWLQLSSVESSMSRKSNNSTEDDFANHVSSRKVETIPEMETSLH